MSLSILRGYTDAGDYRYVRVDEDGRLILSEDTVIDGIGTISTITEITNAVTVEGSIEVSNFPTTIEVSNFPTEIEVSNIPTDIEVSNFPEEIKVNEYEFDETIVYNSGYITLEGGTEDNEVYELTVPYDASKLNKTGTITITNLSGFYDLDVQYRTKVVIGGSTVSSSTNHYAVPSVSKFRATTDAYSSCVTYNKTGTVWTDESIHFDNEYGYPATFQITEVDDAIYFGAKSKFNQLSLMIDTAGVYNGTLIWEFWNGSQWKEPTVLVDNSDELQIDSGKYHMILFEGLNGWTANQPDATNMVNQFWMRLRCSVFNSKTTDPVVMSALFKPVHTTATTTHTLNMVFGSENNTSQILVSPAKDVDTSHEVVFMVVLS